MLHRTQGQYILALQYGPYMSFNRAHSIHEAQIIHNLIRVCGPIIKQLSPGHWCQKPPSYTAILFVMGSLTPTFLPHLIHTSSLLHRHKMFVDTTQN